METAAVAKIPFTMRYIKGFYASFLFFFGKGICAKRGVVS
jgi:hypothetical protein